MTTSEIAKQKTAKPKTAAGKKPRQAQLNKLLSRKSGVTIAQLQKTFGWQPHTARAAISSQRKAGCVVARTETDKGSVYRIIEGQGDR
ncbi:DUF3489 domain-containing protein [uncultured Roseovarius sp.]|uniref:DUF3489 domain-containing protein n=1 Tax=uncultured Roseovarius sp. TaxID=293344 RepID=UPI0025E7DE2A|nr:DUF3489 domain-containing protein [uncultured Roseovarius sp.]